MCPLRVERAPYSWSVEMKLITPLEIHVNNNVFKFTGPLAGTIIGLILEDPEEDFEPLSKDDIEKWGRFTGDFMKALGIPCITIKLENARSVFNTKTNDPGDTKPSE